MAGSRLMRCAARAANHLAALHSFGAPAPKPVSLLQPAAWWPVPHLRQRRILLRLGHLRSLSSQAVQQGTVKMWNEERGFGFITPAGEGGDDVFVHRSALGEGVTLMPGQTVSYEAIWDEKKRKDRAANVVPLEPADSEVDTPKPQQPQRGSSAATRSHNIVGAFSGWQIQREPMTSSGGTFRYKLRVRSDAPKGEGDLRREEFQIVGDASWDHRIYPAGGDGEEVVVLQSGGASSKAASDRGKGHGRNWAVQGKPGTNFDIIYDPAAQTVSCEVSSG